MPVDSDGALVAAAAVALAAAVSAVVGGCYYCLCASNLGES